MNAVAPALQQRTVVHPRWLDASAVAVLMLFGLLVLHPTLRAQFVLVDDHEILSLSDAQGKAPSGSLGLDLPGMILQSDPPVGRFRPLYWTLRFAQVAVFGDNALAYHAVVLALGLAAAALLYATALTLGASRLAALLLGGWLLVAPGVSSLRVRLGADDTSATFFLVLAAFAAARASRGRRTSFWDWVLVIAGLAAILTKESFALGAPALAAFRWLLVGRQRRLSCAQIPPSALVILCFGGLSLLTSALVGSAGGPLSHGGRYFAPPSALSYVRSLAQNGAIVAFAGIAWVAPLIVVGLSGGPSRRRAVVVSGLALLLIVPQLLLYSLQGVLEGKYEDIAALGVAAWMMAGVVAVERRGALRLYRAALTLWAASVAAFGISTWTYATYFAEDSLQLDRVVTAVTSATAAAQTVGIAADPGRQFEPVTSLAQHIEHEGRADLRTALVALPSDRPYTALEASLAQTLAEDLPPPANRISCGGLGAVIVLGDEASTRAAMPCTDSYRRIEFTSSVWLWGGEGVSLRPRLPGQVSVGYVLLVREEGLASSSMTARLVNSPQVPVRLATRHG